MDGLRWTVKERTRPDWISHGRGADASGYCGMFMDSDKRKRDVPA
jgi:hypothetical protein